MFTIAIKEDGSLIGIIFFFFFLFFFFFFFFLLFLLFIFSLLFKDGEKISIIQCTLHKKYNTLDFIILVYQKKRCTLVVEDPMLFVSQKIETPMDGDST